MIVDDLVVEVVDVIIGAILLVDEKELAVDLVLDTFPIQRLHDRLQATEYKIPFM